MAKYLGACVCGRQHQVETRQAGESFACDCGAKITVPTLRQLRQLPEAREEIAASTGTPWGARQGAMTVSLLLAAVSLAIAGLSRYSERPVPTLDSVAYTQNVNRLVTNMTPLQAWERWIDTYQPLTTTGFEVYKHPATDAIQKNLDWHRWIQLIAVGLAAVFGVMAVVLGVSGGKQSKA
jgi:hypothetical protein